MKVIPIWKLQSSNQIGLDLGFTFSKFDYLASGSFYQLQLDLILIRILVNFKVKEDITNE